MTGAALAADRRTEMIASFPRTSFFDARMPGDVFVGCAGIMEGVGSCLTVGTTSFYPEPIDSASGLNARPLRLVHIALPRSNGSRRRVISKTRKCRLRASYIDSSISLKNFDIRRMSSKYFEFSRFDPTRLQPPAHRSEARMNLSTGREVPEMESRSELQTAVSRR